jgi:hypothetical protein
MASDSQAHDVSPNKALHRIAARLRFGLKAKGYGVGGGP